MLYRSCSGGTCPCIKTKTLFVDMLRVTPILGHLKNLGKGPLQNDSRFLNITQDTPRCSNKNLYKMSLWKNNEKYIYMKSAPRASKNGLYKMREPKPIFWAKPCPAQNDGLCRARAHPFCAGNFKGDELLFCGSSVLKTRILKEATFLGEKLRAEILS